MFNRIKRLIYNKRLIHYIVFGSICLIFVFIGIPIDQTSSVGGAAVVVNNHIISWSEYRNYLETLRSEAKPPVDSNLEAQHQDQLRRQAIDSLLNTELIAQSALKSGVLAANKSVQNRIVQIPFFQEEGRFKRSKYLLFLSGRKFSSSYFENLIRKEIVVSRFQNFFTKSVSVSKDEREKHNKLKTFKVNVSYVQFKSSDFNLEEREPFEALVKEGMWDQVDQILKDKNLSWEKTGFFDLTRLSLPDLSLHKSLFEEVIKKLPQTGFINRVLKSRDQSFILKVDNFQKGGEEIPLETDTIERTFIDQMISQMVFFNWMQSVRESAQLQFNPRLSSLMEKN